MREAGLSAGTRTAAWAVVAAGLSLLGCAGEAVPGSAGAEAGRGPLTRWLTMAGARLVGQDVRSGIPLPGGAPAPFTPFVRPSAVAVSGNTVYVADLAPGRLYRLDIATNAMDIVANAPVRTGTALAMSRGEFLYVLDRPGRRVLQFGRDGRLLATFADRANLIRPVAFAVDDARGLVYVADGAANHLVAFHHAGGASFVIGLRGDDRNPAVRIGALALAADGFLISDPLCRCVAKLAFDGRVLATFGHQQVGQPGAIAVDRVGRVFVADAFDSRLKIFVDRRLAHDLPPSDLGVAQLADLSIDGDTLAVADGAGSRVVLLRLNPRDAER